MRTHIRNELFPVTETTLEEVDVFTEFQKAERARDQQIKPWQRTLDDGDYAVCNYKAPNNNNRIETIYCHISKSYYPRDISELIPLWRTRVYARAYSRLCIEGETGTFHRSCFRKKISRKSFEAAKAKHWPLLPSLGHSGDAGHVTFALDPGGPREIIVQDFFLEVVNGQFMEKLSRVATNTE